MPLVLPRTFTATSINDVAPGKVFAVGRAMATDLPACLMLDSQVQDGIAWLYLDGPNAFQIAMIRRTEPPPVTYVIEYGVAEMELELPVSLRSDPEVMNTPGGLALTPDGAFIVARRPGQGGFRDPVYVSLHDYRFVPNLAERGVTYFAQWKLHALNGRGERQFVVVDRPAGAET